MFSFKRKEIADLTLVQQREEQANQIKALDEKIEV